MSKFEKSVAILIETGDSWGRNIVEAIAQFSQLARWAIVISPRDADGRLRLPESWRGHGAIVMLRNAEMAAHIRRANIPAVDVDVLLQQETWLGRVATDDDARAQMAFEHFRARNFEHFAYFAPPIDRYPDQRSHRFREIVEEAGFHCDGFGHFRHSEHGWNADFNQVAQWLTSLPQPLAVFAPDPYPARQLTEICQSEGIRIPDSVAILAGDTDDLLCGIASPPISSIELNCREIATQACRLLADMMDGVSVPDQPQLIPPLRVIPRLSTDILAIDDPQIAQVLLFIREHACTGLGVPDILRAFPISRRALEQRFRNSLGRSIADEIRKNRIENARRLLIETDKSIAVIAQESGFSSGAELAHTFRRYLGAKPSSFRGKA